LYVRKTGSPVRQILFPTGEDLGFAMQLAEPLLKRVRPQRAV
jgi:hypothetical protein